MSALYRLIITRLDPLVPSRYQTFWNHPAGPKTVHFWAPTVKWALVIAGLADMARPPEKLSVRQSGALAATGCIWARYCLVIIPKNYYLFSVNMFLGTTGFIQLTRIYLHQKSLNAEQIATNTPAIEDAKN